MRHWELGKGKYPEDFKLGGSLLLFYFAQKYMQSMKNIENKWINIKIMHVS